MRKMKKFAKGGGAEAKRNRRMADIESDYKKAIARGVSEKEARAKRAQREADARDDYAKRTGADRTQTRAAEKAAEARLSAARRSPDKDMKSVSVASEGPSRQPLVDTSAKVGTPKVGGSSAGRQTFSQAFAAARKDGAKTFTWNGKSYTTQMRGGNKPIAPAAPTRTQTRSGSKPTAPAAPAKGAPRPAASAGKMGLTPDQYRRAVSTGVIPGNASAEDRANLHATIKAVKEAKFAQPRGYAKGGSVDGAAVRGKTRAPMKKGK